MPAKQPENSRQSSDGQNTETINLSVPLKVGSSDIDEVIRQHLIDCDQCRETTENSRPVKLGQWSGHCGTYWQLQLDRADYEGKVNNIVAHTELGDEAPTQGRLQ
jgi:hypothetical protein